MRPVLFTIDSVPISSYSFMVAIAFIVALFVAIKRAKKCYISAYVIFDISLYMLISGFIGARAFYILQHISHYESIDEVLQIGAGGFTFYGGFILASLVFIIYVNLNKLPAGKIADILAPPLALGIGISRIGCFLSGCCFGKPTSLPFGISFPPNSLPWIEFEIQKVHPAQIYSLVSLIVIFIILLSIEKYIIFSGQLFILFILLYSIQRFYIDFFRYYPQEQFINYLTESQLISVVLIVFALTFTFIYTNNRNMIKNEK